MHKKRIQKFQNSGIVQQGLPATQNSGFGILSSLGKKSTSIGTGSFNTNFPQINAAANAGDPFASMLKTKDVLNQAKQTLDEASKIKNPFTGQEVSTPTTATDGGDKTPFAATKAGKAIMTGGAIVGAVAGFMPDKDKDVNSTDAAMKKVRGTVQQGLITTGIPLLAGIGYADMLVDKLGGHADASKGLGTGTDVANAVASFVPGAGWLAGKTEKYSQSQDIKNSSAYTNEVAAGEKVARNAGARLLFGRGKANDIIRAQKRRDRMTEGVLADARDDFAASNYGGISMGNEVALEGGVRAAYVKQGAKLSEARRILKKAAPAAEAVEIFREGGKVNVIPSGQLHKNKHHMEDVGDEYKDLTSKGIPVVTEGDGGELVQQAEIERDEIIFNIDVTRKLEELMEDGSDEAALEAGKLLAIEIMENTVDNTGLMEEIS